MRRAVTAIGVVLGAGSGWLYWHYHGCDQGCAITGSPVNSSLYGALMGFLLARLVIGDRYAPDRNTNNTNTNMLRTLFGMGPKVDLSELARNGATILDVRTKAEYAEGHVKGSINIPLDRLAQDIARVPKDKAVIACCRSGARSGMAIGILKQHGREAYNGGSWTNVRALLSR